MADKLALLTDELLLIRREKELYELEVIKQRKIFDNKISELEKNIELLSDFPEHDLISLRGVFTIRGDFEKYGSRIWREYLTRFNEFLSDMLNDKKNYDLRKYDLEVQDNSYGGDSTPYLSAVRKGMGTRYHPCLFAISLNRDASDENIEKLFLFVSFLLNSEEKFFDSGRYDSHAPRGILKEFLELNN